EQGQALQAKQSLAAAQKQEIENSRQVVAALKAGQVQEEQSAKAKRDDDRGSDGDEKTFLVLAKELKHLFLWD
ncbi:MAG: hypothetical protein V4492_04340, partial [Chlamydiota bacterium]